MTYEEQVVQLVREFKQQLKELNTEFGNNHQCYHVFSYSESSNPEVQTFYTWELAASYFGESLSEYLIYYPKEKRNKISDILEEIETSDNWVYYGTDSEESKAGFYYFSGQKGSELSFISEDRDFHLELMIEYLD